MTNHHHDENVSPADKEHLIKAELIERLSPFYEFHEQSLLTKIKHYFTHEHHHALIDLKNFQQKDIKSYTPEQITQRTVFALKKIKEFNHHFFNEYESRILSPIQTGFFPEFLRFGFCAINSFYLLQLWRNWSFNIKSIGFLAGMIVVQKSLIQVPNLINERIANQRRFEIAQDYLQVYQSEFFHEIINPAYDFELLKHLHNLKHIHDSQEENNDQHKDEKHHDSGNQDQHQHH